MNEISLANTSICDVEIVWSFKRYLLKKTSDKIIIKKCKSTIIFMRI